MSILVFVESAEGQIKKTSLEAVAYAHALGSPVTAIALGAVDQSALEALGKYGAQKVLHASDARLNEGVIQAYTSVLVKAMQDENADILVLANSSLGTPVAARVAIKTGASLATNVTDATKVFEAAKTSRGIFQVGHNRRFAPVYATLKTLIAENHPPHSAHVKMNRGELLKPVWTGDPEVTGGFLYQTPIHMFDMMRFLFGEVTTLHAI